MIIRWLGQQTNQAKPRGYVEGELGALDDSRAQALFEQLERVAASVRLKLYQAKTPWSDAEPENEE